MKLQHVFYAVGVCALLLTAACGNKAPSVDYSQIQPPRVQEDNQSRQIAQEFVNESISAAMMTVEMAQDVDDRIESLEINELTASMLLDYRSAGAELKSIAASKGWTWPKQMSDKHQASADHLRAVDSERLDTEFLEYTISTHEEAIAVFETCADATDDAHLKKWIDKRLPIMLRHVEHCKRLTGELSEGS